MSLGKAIAEFRKKQSWNQAELAKRLEVHPSYVTRWETDKVRPRMKMLERLADVLEVSVQDLLVGRNRQPGRDAQHRRHRIARTAPPGAQSGATAEERP